MEKHGTAFCELYWWDEDRSVIYIKLLSVDKWCRRRHLGTSLLKLCEQIGIEIGSVIACLTVKKHTWVHTWYKRKGYKDTETNYQDRTFMDMKKYLSKGESTNE